MESLSDYTAEEIITGQDLQLGEESYEKLIVYFLQAPEAIDVENYRVEEKAEEGYALLIFSAEEDANLEVLRIQVAHKQKEALETFLFGEEEESEVEVNSDCPSNFCCLTCGRDLTISSIRLGEIFPNSTLVENDGSEYATLFNTALQTGEFNTCDRQAKLFAQIAHESANFNATVEGQINGNEMEWSLNHLLSYFKKTKGAKRHWFNQKFWDDKEYKDFITVNYYETVNGGEIGTHKSEGDKDCYGVWNGENQSNYHVKIRINFKVDDQGDHVKYTVPASEKDQHRKNIFRFAYGKTLGNADPDDEPGTEDGWLYRGKGAIQLTGKNNYQKNQEEILEWFNLNFDLVGNPNLVSDNKTVVVYSAIVYILQNVTQINDIDSMTIDQFSALVNTGNENTNIENVNGAPDRRNRYTQLTTNENLFECNNANQEEEGVENNRVQP